MFILIQEESFGFFFYLSYVRIQVESIILYLEVKNNVLYKPQYFFSVIYFIASTNFKYYNSKYQETKQMALSDLC